MHEWYYSQGSQQLGPVSWEQLVELAASGQLAATDLVWKHPMPNWVAAASVAGLMPAPPVYGAPSYGMPSTSGSPVVFSAPVAGGYTPPYDPGNPYAAPQAPPSASGANASGWLTQMTVVSILMMVQGGLECAYSLIFPFIGMIDDGPAQQPDGPPQAVFWLLGGAVLVGGLLKLVGGFLCFRFRARPVGFVALGSSILSLCTCYCVPTTLALSIYGLIVLLNEHVAAAFALGAQGLSREEIIARFR